MYDFLSRLRPWYWRLALLNASMMWIQSMKHPNQDSSLPEIMLWIFVGCFSIGVFLWIDQLWCWVQHEYAIQRILNNQHFRGGKVLLDELVDYNRLFALGSMIWLIVDVTIGTALAVIPNGDNMAYLLSGIFVLMTLFLLGLCAAYRLNRYLRRDSLIVDVNTAFRMTQGDRFYGQTIQLHSPNDLKIPRSYLISL